MTKSWEEEGRETPSLTVERVTVQECMEPGRAVSVMEVGGSDFNGTIQTSKW
jgi:hypothetical protein